MSLQGAQKLTEGIRMTGVKPWLPGMVRGTGRSIMEGSCVCDMNCPEEGGDLWVMMGMDDGTFNKALAA